MPIGNGELFGFRTGVFKIVVQSPCVLSKLVKDVVRIRTLWIERLYQEKQRLNEQEILASILNFALEPVSLKEMLEQFLILVLKEEGYGAFNKGSIFLANHETKELEMVSQYGLPEAVTNICKR